MVPHTHALCVCVHSGVTTVAQAHLLKLQPQAEQVCDTGFKTHLATWLIYRCGGGVLFSIPQSDGSSRPEPQMMTDGRLGNNQNTKRCFTGFN